MNKKYVIIQLRTEKDDDGNRTAIKEVLLAYPDSKTNAMKRINKWKSVLEIPNLSMLEATSKDYRKRSKKKKNKS